ncbi:tyrosine-type recombinase/integrase [Novosphingobium sp.]|uniref:tyrosine-type recombinase/integrase n=1 Tax=Novosphingobium sp. TaxID=1874826 RepID=UPI002633C095|nr:tyrosine-type recombinase/integrase [Novosphingobium sp.]
MNRKRIRSNKFLPKYVTRFDSQHGAPRYRFRHKDLPGGYFKAEPGTEEFRQEYHAFLHPGEVEAPEVAPRYAAGSIDDIVSRYVSVPERLGPSEVTQSKIRAILEDFREGVTQTGLRIGTLPTARVTFEAIDKIVARKRVKTGKGNKTKGGVHAAQKLRKELVRLFDFAVKSRMIDHNPAALAEKVRLTVAERTGGFHSWTEDEIQMFRDHHALGTRERLAMELILWTDQRRCDVVRMGKAQIVDGCLPVEQEKTGATLWIPMPPQLLEAVIAMKPSDTSPFCFLMTKRGQPFRKESFGNFFKKACVDAGLPHCSAHGLRKATLRRMAELEMANELMKSVSGQKSDKVLAIYTRAANQKKLASSAMDTLAKWEMSARQAQELVGRQALAND